MTTASKKVVWEGAKACRRLLVPISTLEPFPGNPNKGDVDEIRKSLRRFGQVKPILVDSTRIIAGHHFVQACVAEGFTHVAAIENEFTDEDEARAYLLADNQIPKLAAYDDELLAAQLRALRDTDNMEGTGFADADVDAALARLAASGGAGLRDLGQRAHRDNTMKELVLIFSADQLEQVEVWLGIVGKAEGTAGPSETVFNALRDAAHRANA